MRQIRRKKNSTQSGFSLVELLISLLVMSIVIGVTLNGVNRAQKRNAAESMKLDMTQQAREGLDQIVRDLHQAGYPSPTMYASVTSGGSNYAFTIGPLTTGAQSAVTFEGDVDGDGSVDVVTYTTAPVSGSTCPCTIQRTINTKGSPALNTSTLIENVQSFSIVPYDSTGGVAPGNLPQPTLAAPNDVSRLDLQLEITGQQAEVDTKQKAAASFRATIRYNNK
jgi:prepilin-type N-terminal cleavage/methylation domain-containing protein